MDARRGGDKKIRVLRVARRRLRATGLIVLGLASVGTGVWLQFSTRSALPLGEASTAQLLGILGLLVLPAVSLMLVAAERR
jgi:hypothetical protein